jgi:MFS transporter, ACS family, hexuronate transporter
MPNTLARSDRPSDHEPYHRIILVLVMLAQVVCPMVVFSIGALAPLLRESLHISREQVGYLAALFFASTSLVSIPAGLVADKLGIRFLLIVAQVVGGLPLAAIPFLQTYHELLVVMFLVGLAWGTVTILTTKAIVEWFPFHRRATAIGLKQAGMPFSGGLAAAMVPGLALWIGWRQALAVLGGMILASAACDLLLYRDAPKTAPPKMEPRRTAPSPHAVFRNPQVWMLATVGLLFAGSQVSLATYLALFLHESLGFPLLIAASLLAQAQVGGAAGRVLYGFVSDRWLRGERKRLLLGIGGVALVPLLALALLPPGTAYLALSPLIILYGLSGMSWNGVHMTLVAELSGRESAGVGVGISMTLVNAGNIIMPPLFGYAADVTGSYTLSWGLLILWLALGLALLACVRAPGTAP